MKFPKIIQLLYFKEKRVKPKAVDVPKKLKTETKQEVQKAVAIMPVNNEEKTAGMF